jgi:hypothetical protein
MILLTPEALAACYDYLRTQPPFEDWNLPDSEDIWFKVIKSRKVYGQAWLEPGRYEIHVSQSRVGSHLMLLTTMAHEMAHVFQHSACFQSKNHHDRAFWALADEICEIHQFDRMAF